MASNTKGRIGKKISAIWRRNPVLSMGLGLMPAIVATSSLKNAISMCVVVGVIMIPTYLLAALLKLKKPFYIRIAINALIAALFSVPSIWLVSKIFPDFVHGNIYVYMSSVIVDTLIIYRADEYARHTKLPMALLDGLVNFVGFSLVVLIVAIFRELLGAGTIFGITIYQSKYTIPGFVYPFFGFIAIGMLAAFVNFLNMNADRKRAIEALLDSMDEEDRKKQKHKKHKNMLSKLNTKLISASKSDSIKNDEQVISVDKQNIESEPSTTITDDIKEEDN